MCQIQLPTPWQLEEHARKHEQFRQHLQAVTTKRRSSEAMLQVMRQKWSPSTDQSFVQNAALVAEAIGVQEAEFHAWLDLLSWCVQESRGFTSACLRASSPVGASSGCPRTVCGCSVCTPSTFAGRMNATPAPNACGGLPESVQAISDGLDCAFELKDGSTMDPGETGG